MQFCGIDGFGRFVKDGSGGSGGSAGLNFFTQLDEPSIKDGVWIKTTSKHKRVITNNQTLSDNGVWSDIIQRKCGGTNCKAVVYNGEIHILGGGSYPTSHHVGYNNTDVTLPYAFTGGGAVVFNNKIHILGGTYSDFKQYHYEFDGTTWTSVSTLPYKFTYGQAVVFNGEIHIIGGINNETSHYKFDGTTWTSVSTLPYIFFIGSAVVFNGEIHIIGGNGDRRANYKFNGTTWTSVSALPYDFANGSAVVFNNAIHILGSGTDVENQCKHYKFDGTTWTSVSTIPFNHYNMYCIVYENNIVTGKDISNCYEFSLPESVFESNTIIMQRGDHNGIYLTNFVDVSQISGEHNRFVTGFDDVWYFDQTAFDMTSEMYYGDGTKWIKFKN